MKLKPIIIAVAMILALAAPALAQAPQASIRIDGAWARPTPPNAKTAAAYMTLVNVGTADDRLVSVSTPVAGEADVHRTTEDNGVMKMSPAGPIDVKRGTPTVLQPAGLHVMMMDLKAPLTEGHDFPITLVFEKAGKVETTVHVQRMGPVRAGGGMGNMGPMNMPSGDHMNAGHMNMGH